MKRSATFRASELTNVARNSTAFELKVVQDPQDGRALAKPEKTRGARWPLDPPPVVEFNLHDNDQSRSFLHSPFWFCTAELDTISPDGQVTSANGLTGTTVSSLNKIKLNDNKERGFFIFGDLHIKDPGTHRIRFSLFEMRQNSNGMFAEKLNSVYSKGFKVHQAKSHIRQRESTALSRTLCEAGVKLRIRKESTKRRTQVIDWSMDGALPSGPHHGQLLPPPNPGMPPPTRPFSTQNAPNYHTAGENVSHRLSLGNTSLGIREHLDRVGQDSAKSRQMATYRSSDGWYTPQQSYSAQNYAPETLQGWYSTPPSNSPGSDLRTSYPQYTNGGYHASQAAMPPSPYSMTSGGHLHTDQNQPRSADHQILFDQPLFDQPQRHSDAGPPDYGHSDSAQYTMNSFPTAPNMSYVLGSNAAYPNYTASTRNYPIASTSGGEGVNHFS